MKTVIYYFTGTGNSLAAAKKIAADLGDCELVPIVSFKDTTEDIVPPAVRVGIVCPVYDAGLPVIVWEFAQRLSLAGTRYVFGIVTLGGSGGTAALRQLDQSVKQQNGRGLSAAFSVRMPGNFPPVSRPPQGKKKDGILAGADAQLKEAAGRIKKGEQVPPGFSPFAWLMHAATYRFFSGSVHAGDKDFSVSCACTSCGTCAKVCPVGNIRMEQGRPAWQHHCEFCCACLHFCPVEAIDLHSMRGTKGRGRYRHPAVTLEDMKVQAGR
ncbi:4Fe-4S ferredoxin, iron-sulfur binding domain protein [Methanoregula boonei 6A8]|jgi:ferredoxin|uniref:4Fe-4S ferredoxin, iron-sulfur binding domain protein n=1 Tax=Methanoregula boonei (strain DSM 21154 / JCM 14090 / 6A8) TaxID=456442 RepID=A7I554_METB6|nr:EFR1 family ferrodoxin [Methanoregula boonei]ABS54865.1 4Fe-4S ferredoxin, iron-sulfur binding domain protein [Methanoregula boonei 6A8]